MRYYKQISGDYLPAIGTGNGGDVEITEDEYNEILAVVQSCPNEDGKGFHLKTDLTWEAFNLPVVEPELSGQTKVVLNELDEAYQDGVNSL